MPLPMVHLAIATGVSAKPSAEFLLGALAPDAIHMRPGTSRRDKNATHIVVDAREWPEAPVRRWLAGYRNSPAPLRELARGYAMHVLCDRLWGRTVFQSFRRAVSALDEASLRALYYRETDQIDMDLYRTVPWREKVWRLLAEARAYDVAGLLTAGEIDAWRQRTLKWYDAPEHDPAIAPRYFTRARVEAYIEDAVSRMAEAHTWPEWR